jgi:hypothetical protein
LLTNDVGAFHQSCRTVPIFTHIIRNKGSRDSEVGIVTGYGLDDQGVGVRVPVGARIFTSPCRPDRLWGPLNLLSNEHRGFFPRGSRKRGFIHPLPHTSSWRNA